MPTSTVALLQFLAAQSTAWDTRGSALAQTATALYASNLGILEVAGVVATIGFGIGIVILMVQTRWLKSRIEKWRHVVLNADPGKDQVKRSWKDIERHFFAGNDNDLKIAIIEADKTLDNAMRNAGIIGATLGDRLKKVKPAQLPNLEDIWQAHKLRNQIAHDDETALKRDIAERALTAYKQALEYLGALGK